MGICRQRSRGHMLSPRRSDHAQNGIAVRFGDHVHLRRIVQINQIQVRVENRVGDGTRFALYSPMNGMTRRMQSKTELNHGLHTHRGR